MWRVAPGRVRNQEFSQMVTVVFRVGARVQAGFPGEVVAGGRPRRTATRDLDRQEEWAERRTVVVVPWVGMRRRLRYRRRWCRWREVPVGAAAAEPWNHRVISEALVAAAAVVVARCWLPR